MPGAGNPGRQARASVLSSHCEHAHCVVVGEWTAAVRCRSAHRPTGIWGLRLSGTSVGLHFQFARCRDRFIPSIHIAEGIHLRDGTTRAEKDELGRTAT